MRIITGEMRGKRLKTLEGENTRPTSEKVKEALFSAIQFDIEGRRVLDLFAGSGQLGLEALSRGAAFGVFVDSSKDAVKIITDNITECGYSEKATLKTKDYNAFLLQNSDRFDIVFIDPPYKSGVVWDALSKIAPFVNKGGVVICEHPANVSGPESAGELVISRSYKYGKTALTFYRYKEMAE